MACPGRDLLSSHIPHPAKTAHAAVPIKVIAPDPVSTYSPLTVTMAP